MTPVSPCSIKCCPLSSRGNDNEAEDGDDEAVDPKMAALGEPIVGVENVVWDDISGPGASAARPLSDPKAMSAVQKAAHDLTHLPYHPGCDICVASRRPNNHHRSVQSSEREIPHMVGDYAFPKNAEDEDPMTILVIRLYPYKLMMCCVVASKGRDQRIVNRIC